MTPKVSVVINAQNAEPDLSRAIASIKNFADEIVVLDQGSSDKTAEIAKKLGAQVFNHNSVSYVEIARNLAISKAKGDWIFVLDPDEEVTPDLSRKIKEIVKDPKADFYRIPRKNIIFGKWMKHTLWWPDYQVRFFKKGKVSWSEIIHAVPMTSGMGADLSAEENIAILHHNYDSVDQYLEKMNRYTRVQADFLKKEGKKFEWNNLITKPFKEFINRFFVGEGYKDGAHGLALSLLQAFSELVTFIKLWQLEKFEEKNINLKEFNSLVGEKEKELHFWRADASYKESGKISDKIRRKLRI